MLMLVNLCFGLGTFQTKLKVLNQSFLFWLLLVEKTRFLLFFMSTNHVFLIYQNSMFGPRKVGPILMYTDSFSLAAQLASFCWCPSLLLSRNLFPTGQLHMVDPDLASVTGQLPGTSLPAYSMFLDGYYSNLLELG